MIRYIFKLALRNVIKYRMNSVINLIGLTLAMSSLMPIFLWVRHELSYDDFHNNKNEIVRVVGGNPSDKESFAGTPSPLGRFLGENFPEVRCYSRFYIYRNLTKVENIVYDENRVAAADSGFFEIFSYPLIRGNKNDALTKYNSVLLSETTANKYFGNKDPLGKTIMFSDSIPYEVTGIFKDIPGNSHIHFDLLVPFKSLHTEEDWSSWNYYTYLLFSSGTRPEQFKDKTVKWAEKNFPDRLDIIRDLYYQPLNQIHFQYNRYNPESSVDKLNISLAIAVALLILIIACINFANLTTLQALERAKEIAVRKILGESGSRLKRSMFLEALSISILSFFLAAMLLENLLPFVNKLLYTSITFSWTEKAFLIAALAMILGSASLSGIYPAFILSSFRPIDLFRNSFKLSGRQSLRKGLVVFQFCISILLLSCIFMFNRQMHFINKKNLGLNLEQVISINLQSKAVARHSKELKSELLKNPEVISASVNDYVPSEFNSRWGGIHFNEINNGNPIDDISLWIIMADKDFIKTMQLRVIEGNELINNYTSSEIPFILNESAAKLVTGKVVVGKVFDFRPDKQAKIIGKVEDFHLRSLHHKIEPTAIILSGYGSQISIRFKSEDIRSTLESFKQTWDHFSNGLPFSYYFMNEDYGKLYRSEIAINKMLKIGGFLSLILCCLGIYGIVSYSAKRRSKEIGLRKINGASVSEIIALMSKNYIWWIVISFIAACPPAIFIIGKWLQHFAYRADMSWWIFALAGIIALGIALLTVIWQSWNVATKNPVDALRYE
jgi:putative ABC transport system permease protein